MQARFVQPVDNFTDTVVTPARDAKKSWEAIKKDDLGISKSLETVIAATGTPSADALKLYEHLVPSERLFCWPVSIIPDCHKLEKKQSITKLQQPC